MCSLSSICVFRSNVFCSATWCYIRTKLVRWYWELTQMLISASHDPVVERGARWDPHPNPPFSFEHLSLWLEPNLTGRSGQESFSCVVLSCPPLKRRRKSIYFVSKKWSCDPDQDGPWESARKSAIILQARTEPNLGGTVVFGCENGKCCFLA